MRRVVATALAGAALASVLAACQLIAGIDEYDEHEDASVVTVVVQTPPPDAGGDQCRHREPPPADGGASSTNTLYFALDTLDFTTVNLDAGTPGFDLDGVCTGFTGGPTYLDGGSSCQPAPGTTVAELADSPGGVDNAIQRIFTLASQTTSGLSALLPTDDHIEDGLQTVLLRLVGYDGQANSIGLTVEALVSESLETTVDCDAGTFVPFGTVLDAGPPADDDATIGDAGAGDDASFALDASDGSFIGRNAPKDDGCDIWTVSDASLGPVVESDVQRVPLIVSDVAYVSNGTLVATFKTFALPFGSVFVQVHDVALQATLTRPGGTSSPYKLTNGFLAGRVEITALLNAFKAVGLATHDPGLCPGNPTYDQLLKPALCGAVDISYDAAAPVTARCDALSFGASLSATQTRREGDVVVAPVFPIKSNCDAAIDTCPN